MTSSEEPDHQDWTGRLSPTDVHHVVFSRVGLGRRGYDEIEVDVFLERVEHELSRLIAERDDLRDEVSRLQSRPTPSPAAPSASDSARTLEEAQRQAVRLLAAAQQTADTYVTGAESYSQRLTADARERAERMVADAREAAQRMLMDAGLVETRTSPSRASGPASESDVGRDPETAYVGALGQVVRGQLRAYLEALLQDVDHEWERAEQSAPVATLPTPAQPDLPNADVTIEEHERDVPQQRVIGRRDGARVAPEVVDAGGFGVGRGTDTSADASPPRAPESVGMDRGPVASVGVTEDDPVAVPDLPDAQADGAGPLAVAVEQGDAIAVPEPTDASADDAPVADVAVEDDDALAVPEVDAPAAPADAPAPVARVVVADDRAFAEPGMTDAPDAGEAPDASQPKVLLGAVGDDSDPVADHGVVRDGAVTDDARQVPVLDSVDSGPTASGTSPDGSQPDIAVPAGVPVGQPPSHGEHADGAPGGPRSRKRKVVKMHTR